MQSSPIKGDNFILRMVTVVLPSSYRKLLNFNNLRVYTNYKDHRIIIHVSPKPFLKLNQSFTDVFERNNLHILWNH